jgi:hypothetical protein
MFTKWGGLDMKKFLFTFAILFIQISFILPGFCFADDWYENLESLTPTKPPLTSTNVNKNVTDNNMNAVQYYTDARNEELLRSANASEVWRRPSFTMFASASCTNAITLKVDNGNSGGDSQHESVQHNSPA